MIRWTKDGKVDRAYWVRTNSEEIVPPFMAAHELADALDIAVAAIRSIFKSHRECDDAWYSCPKHPEYAGNYPGEFCDCGKSEMDDLLRKFGADHAD